MATAPKLPQYYLPKNFSVNQKLRACMNCGLLRTFAQFCRLGCDNCEEVFQFKVNPERIIMFTSLHFEGIVGITQFNRTWNSKLIYVGEHFSSGAYALYIFGRVTEHVFNDVIGSAVHRREHSYYKQALGL